MLAQRSGGKELPSGLDAVWDGAVGIVGRVARRQQRFMRCAEGVLSYEKHFSDMSDARLRETAGEFRDIFRCGREKDEDLLRAFALVREVAWRQLGERPYLVQVAGAMAIEAGCIAEMATGEGKTLTATMPATISGWRGRGCHVVTFSEYLASRDAEWMEKVYSFCGLGVSHITHDMAPDDRRHAYRADITYGTNKEITADFLRDRLAMGRLEGLSSALLAKIVDGSGSGTDRVVMRGLHRAIVDEADSILIDGAVVPLIISGEAPNPEQIIAYEQAADLAGELAERSDYRTNHRHRDVELTTAGKQRLGDLAESMGGVWRGARRREELVTQALMAREFYTCGKQYAVQDGDIVIVDEFTGRLMPDHEWRDGVHQAVEAKEGLEVNPPKATYARVSFQRFFRLYRRLSGMTGTAAEATNEFWQIYHLPVAIIPTNRPCIRKHYRDNVYSTESAKWDAIIGEIIRVNETTRPILVGTRSVRASEHLSELLSARGLEHQLLNAVRHAEEAQIVAAAGQPGRITVATNMAGRGTDIKLGRGVAELGGLHVIATERHEAERIDRQLFGRSGRQGDPGSCQAFVSLTDELVRRHAPHSAGWVARRYGKSEAAITSPLGHLVFTYAQRRAERLALKQRKGVLRTDDWLDEYLGFAGIER